MSVQEMIEQNTQESKKTFSMIQGLRNQISHSFDSQNNQLKKFIEEAVEKRVKEEINDLKGSSNHSENHS